MSPLRLNGSTSGYSQLDAPAVAGDQTFTLPGTGGTLDRLNRAGNILQVVNGSTSTSTTNSSTTFADTNLSASITPSSSSSKILVMVNQQVYAYRASATQYFGLRLLRDSTVVFTPWASATGPQDFGMNATGATSVEILTRLSLMILDSPGTTSAITYKTQGRIYAGGFVTFQNTDSTNGSSFITLMEVAA